MNSARKYKELFDLELPKWPMLLVVGKAITKDQAAQVLIRTGSFYFSSNDKQFCMQLCNVSDMEWKDYAPKGEGMQANTIKYQVLPLTYLQNHQVTSSWIGGPHGWCDWNGNIRCHTFNIGKYPSIKEVYTDWSKIAEAFPFLNLKCQLFDKESSEEGGIPVVEFSIENGEVDLYLPEAPLLPYEFIQGNDMSEVFTKRMFDPYGERGCMVEQFKYALSLTLIALEQEK